MSLESILTIVSAIATVAGVLVIWWQIRSSHKDAIKSSLLASISEHWMLIEERRMRIRSGEVKVHYPNLRPHLEKLLSEKYNDDVLAMSQDFLAQSIRTVESDEPDVNKLFELIESEYAYYDLIFNLYEEQFITAKYLKLADKKLWDYWLWYSRVNFKQRRVVQIWALRREVGLTFPPFAEHIEKQIIRETKDVA